MTSRGDDQSLGRARVDITGDDSHLDQTLDGARAKVEKFVAETSDKIKQGGTVNVQENADAIFNEMGNNAGRGAAKVIGTTTKEVRSLAQSLNDATKPARELFGALGRIAGIAGAIAGLGYSLKQASDAIQEFYTSKFGDDNKSINEFLDGLADQSNQDRIDALTKKLQKLYAELDYKRENPRLGQVLGRGHDAILGEALQVEKALDAERSKSGSIQKEKEKKQAGETAKAKADIAKRYDEEVEAARISLMEDETDRQVAELSNRKRELWNAEKADGISRQQLIDLLSAKQEQLIKNRNRERAKQEQEDALKNAKERYEIEQRIAEARVRGWVEARAEADAMYARQRQGFGAGDGTGTVASGLERLINEVKRLNSQMGSN